VHLIRHANRIFVAGGSKYYKPLRYVVVEAERRMTRTGLIEILSTLRQAQVDGKRAPHKPLLLLWLFGQFANTGSAEASYAEAAGPVSALINDFGPPVSNPAVANHRAAMPFVHLERNLWDLRDRNGLEIGPAAPERGRWLLDQGAVGQLRPEVSQLLSDGATLAQAARLLLDQHFTPLLSDMILSAVDLELGPLEAPLITPPTLRRRRLSGFAEVVLSAYGYQCAMCGFDGRLGRNPVAIEAAHVRWHSWDGPDELANAVALCSLHHALFDYGVLGLSAEYRVTVSPHYVGTTDAGRAVYQLDGRPALRPVHPGQPSVDVVYIDWHTVQVFKGDNHRVA
jgi:putative restriction endonuclease